VKPPAIAPYGMKQLFFMTLMVRFLLAGIILFPSWLFLLAPDPSVRVDRVVVYKHEPKLLLLSHRREVRSYKVALGSEAAGPKTRQSDHRTPEGVYVLDRRNPNSHFYKAFHISYPNSKDRSRQKIGSESGK